MIGSLFTVEADSREAVEAFHREDPFNKADLWATVTIHACNKRADNR